MPKGPSLRMVLGALAILAVSGACIYLGLEAAQAPQRAVAARRVQEGWKVIHRGNYQPLMLRPWERDYEHPRELRATYSPVREDTVGFFYFKGSKPFPSSSKNHARLEIPSGDFVDLEVESVFQDQSTCLVQIPAAYRPSTDHLTLRLVIDGQDDTVVRIDKPPATEEAFPHGATTKAEETHDGVAIRGHAFQVVSPKDKLPTGIGGEITWTKLDPSLYWRTYFDSPSRAFQRLHGTKSPPGFSSIDGLGQQHVKTIQAMPFAGEISTAALRGKIDGFEPKIETVDFGTITILEDKKRKQDGHLFYLTIKSPIHRMLPSGLILTLVPLLDGTKQTATYGGRPSLNFCLRAEPLSVLKIFPAPGLDHTPPIVECQFQGIQSAYEAVTPRSETDSGIPDLHMTWFTPPASRKLKLKFNVRSLQLRRHIPFDLFVPVDKAHPFPYDYFHHDLTGDAVTMD